MLTLNAIDALGEKAAPLHELLRTMPAKDPAATGRANGYVAPAPGRIRQTRRRAADAGEKTGQGRRQEETGRRGITRRSRSPP